MKKDRKAKHYVLAVVLIVVAVLLDQYTKYLAVTNLKDKPAFVLWDKVFELTYLENRGAAFGLLQNRQLFFICIAVVIFVFILYCYIRMRFGYVVDFFYFRLIDFPVFNVADIYVTVSFAVLLLLVFFQYKEEDLEFFGKKKGTSADGE